MRRRKMDDRSLDVPRHAFQHTLDEMPPLTDHVMAGVDSTMMRRILRILRMIPVEVVDHNNRMDLNTPGA